jgi:hypothetical protein
MGNAHVSTRRIHIPRQVWVLLSPEFHMASQPGIHRTASSFTLGVSDKYAFKMVLNQAPLHFSHALS